MIALSSSHQSAFLCPVYGFGGALLPNQPTVLEVALISRETMRKILVSDQTVTPNATATEFTFITHAV